MAISKHIQFHGKVLEILLDEMDTGSIRIVLRQFRNTLVARIQPVGESNSKAVR
jgi:hypothetical protein